MNLSALPITFQATVQAEHLDAMGHMNVTWYVHFFDRATWTFFASFGLDPAYFEERQAGAFALEQHLRYLAEARLGQALTLRSRILARTEKRIHFMHFMILDGSEVLAATSELLGMHIDRRVRRASPIPDDIAATLDALLAEHQALDWEAPICGAMRP